MRPIPAAHHLPLMSHPPPSPRGSSTLRLPPHSSLSSRQPSLPLPRHLTFHRTHQGTPMLHSPGLPDCPFPQTPLSLPRPRFCSPPSPGSLPPLLPQIPLPRILHPIIPSLLEWLSTPSLFRKFSQPLPRGTREPFIPQHAPIPDQRPPPPSTHTLQGRKLGRVRRGVLKMSHKTGGLLSRGTT